MTTNITDLVPDKQNARKHSPRNIDTITGGIKKFGMGRSIFIDEVDGIIAGNATVEAAKAAGITKVRVVETDGTEVIAVRRTNLTPEEKRLMALYDNRTAELASWDATQIAASLEAGLDLSGLFDGKEQAELMRAAADILLSEGGDIVRDAPEPEISRAAELQQKWGVAVGDIWEMGRHKLVCGDCTDPSVLSALMGEELADMVWTDPPYGVSIGDKNKMLGRMHKTSGVKENLVGDTLDAPHLAEMLEAAFGNAVAHCAAGGAWYVAAPQGPLFLVFGAELHKRGIWHQTLQWVKNAPTFAPLGVDYHWRAEPMFYGWLPGAAHRYYGGRQQDTVWNIDRPVKSPEHPTMKPVELVLRAIENSSMREQIVLDPFAGSGTVGCACEIARRQARLVEIAPPYCAVILERMAQMGLTPMRWPV